MNDADEWFNKLKINKKLVKYNPNIKVEDSNDYSKMVSDFVTKDYIIQKLFRIFKKGSLETNDFEQDEEDKKMIANFVKNIKPIDPKEISRKHATEIEFYKNNLEALMKYMQRTKPDIYNKNKTQIEKYKEELADLQKENYESYYSANFKKDNFLSRLFMNYAYDDLKKKLKAVKQKIKDNYEKEVKASKDSYFSNSFSYGLNIKDIYLKSNIIFRIWLFDFLLKIKRDIYEENPRLKDKKDNYYEELSNTSKNLIYAFGEMLIEKSKTCSEESFFSFLKEYEKKIVEEDFDGLKKDLLENLKEAIKRFTPLEKDINNVINDKIVNSFSKFFEKHFDNKRHKIIIKISENDCLNNTKYEGMNKFADDFIDFKNESLRIDGKTYSEEQIKDLLSFLLDESRRYYYKVPTGYGAASEYIQQKNNDEIFATYDSLAGIITKNLSGKQEQENENKN